MLQTKYITEKAVIPGKPKLVSSFTNYAMQSCDRVILILGPG